MQRWIQQVWIVAVAVGSAAASGGTPLPDPVPGPTPAGPFTLQLEEVTAALDFPTDVTAAPDGSGRLFIAERDGRVRVWKAGALLPAPFLDISPTTPSCQGCALSALVFHPRFAVVGDAGEGKIYTVSQEPAGSGLAHFGVASGEVAQSVLYEWRADDLDPDTVDPLSRREILRINEAAAIHNLDQAAFGPDGMLYLSKGDDTTFLGAQDTMTIHGSILRIDVDETAGNGRYSIPGDNPFAGGSGGLPELWAFGFRNPWRLSFDRESGELWVADIGEDDLEEVNRVEAGGNYGWSLQEGSFVFLPGKGVTDDETSLPPDFDGLPPIAEYDQDEGDCSVTGGILYRGAAFPELAGVYLLGDWCSGRLFTLEPATGRIGVAAIDPGGAAVGAGVIGFAEDEAGEPLIVIGGLTPNGTVLRLTAVDHQAVGPPPTVPATLTVSKNDPGGASLDVAWDPSICVDDEAVQLLYGFGDDLPSAPGGVFAPDGGSCGLSPVSPILWSGVPDPGELLWFLLVATDGAGTEGGWGLDSAGQERIGPGPGGHSAACAATVRDLTGACGR